MPFFPSRVRESEAWRPWTITRVRQCKTPTHPKRHTRHTTLNRHSKYGHKSSNKIAHGNHTTGVRATVLTQRQQETRPFGRHLEGMTSHHSITCSVTHVSSSLTRSSFIGTPTAPHATHSHPFTLAPSLSSLPPSLTSLPIQLIWVAVAGITNRSFLFKHTRSITSCQHTSHASSVMRVRKVHNVDAGTAASVTIGAGAAVEHGNTN